MAFWGSPPHPRAQRLDVGDPLELGDESATGRVELYRSNHGWVDRNKPCEVLVDGVAQACVYPRQHAEVRLQEGSHQIAVVFEDQRSKPIEIEVAAGATKRLVCSSRPGSAWFNPLLLGRAIRLKLTESSAE
jgi:hypothetical protein